MVCNEREDGLETGINGEPNPQYDKKEGEMMMSIVRVFDNQEVASWRQQLTVRVFVVGFVLSVVLGFIVMKLNLTTRIIPSLDVSAGLQGFFFVKTWTKMLNKSGLLRWASTRQEITVIQTMTCIVASAGITFSWGFRSYILGMSACIVKQLEETSDYKSPSLGWITSFFFIVCSSGLFSMVLLQKIMIIDFKLMYPSGIATTNLINSLHDPEGAKLAKDDCGFASFPTFGLKAYKNSTVIQGKVTLVMCTFYFDFLATFVGVGMVRLYIVNISFVIGGILSWGLMWSLIETRKGDWYGVDLPSRSMHGL